MEFKYTSDGRKVVIIGNLNAQEKIVQEVFIVNGQEIPSGENFVAKSLHDTLAVSWKEKTLKELEERFERDQTKYNDLIDNLRKDYYKKQTELKAKLEYAGKALKNISPDSFTTLVAFMTGEINWIVKVGYDIELLQWEDFNVMYEDKLRLMSIFGKDDGTLTYAVGDYNDRSGGDKKFYPFKEYEPALEFFAQKLLENGVSDSSLKIASKYNIQFPADKVQEYKDKKTANIKRYCEDGLKKIAGWEEEIKQIEAIN